MSKKILADVWVVCPICRDMHRLEPGDDTPIYFCPARYYLGISFIRALTTPIRKLVPGNEVIYEPYL